MEILRFDESDVPAPKRKSASKGWLALGLVATLMGVGTAFASSTITVNTDNLTPLGQGVTSVVTCDQEIAVVPTTSLNLNDEHDPYFQLNTLAIGSETNPDWGADGLVSYNCANKYFKVTLYNSDKEQIPCSAWVSVDNSQKNECDSSGSNHSIFFQAANDTEHDKSYVINFSGYSLLDHDISNITVETVANYGF